VDVGTERIARLREGMRARGIDVLVCLKPQSSFYLSGFNPIIYSHPVVAVLPMRGDPVLLVHALRDDHARQSAWVHDVRLFGAWSTKRTMGPDWLAALRALSAPTTDSQYPQAMQTPAWAMKTLNCQLASWTELKHDTVLYAKQAVTPTLLCGYPFGFVEPRPEFWQQMQTLADVAARSISALRLSGSVYAYRTSASPGVPPFSEEVDLATVKASQVAFAANFSAQIAILHGIALEELAQQPLTDAETAFIQNLMEWTADYIGTRTYDGWYPKLFYRNVFSAEGIHFDEDQGSAMWDALATDVDTDAPDDIVGDPGAVLHEGVGNVHLLLIAIDNGPDRMVYAGPVFSHYEFEEPTGTRLTDDQWKSMLTGAQKPPSPDWTRSYLVPSP